MRPTSKNRGRRPSAGREKQAGTVEPTARPPKLRVKGKAKGSGKRLVEHLRQHRGDINMTTDEVMDLTRGE